MSPLFSAITRSSPYHPILHRDPPVIKPTIRRPPSAATLTIGQQHLLAGYPTSSHPSSLQKKHPSFSRHTLQTTPQKSNSSMSPLPFDAGELQRAQSRSKAPGHTSGSGKSHTNPRNTRGGGKSSRRDTSGNGSRKLSVRELVCAAAENGTELDLNRGLDDGDQGKYWADARRDNHRASRMSPLSFSPACHLTHGWRFCF